MSSPPHEKLTRREREIMDALFALGDRASAEDIRKRLSDPPSYSAVRAMLVRLEAKGYVRHSEQGLRYVYSRTKSRASAQHNALETVCACYWLHPLVWVAWRRLCLEAERACDDAVIQNEESTDYAEQLVSLARRMSKAHAQPVLGMANRSDLSRRISAVLDSTQHRGRAGLLAVASAMIVAGVIVLAIAPLHAVPQSPGKQQSGSLSKQTQARRSSPLDRALHEAAESGDVSDIERLLDAGANVNCALEGDGSPLIGAAREGHFVAVQILLDRGADPNMPVPGDGNPLIMSAREGHAAVVALLLDRGAFVDEMVPGDENALIQASGSGQLAVVKLLVSRGANVNAQVWVEENFPGGAGEWRSALSMAQQGGHTEVVAYLLSAGARE